MACDHGTMADQCKYTMAVSGMVVRCGMVDAHHGINHGKWEIDGQPVSIRQWECLMCTAFHLELESTNVDLPTDWFRIMQGKVLCPKCVERDLVFTDS